jgi:hypothetical protein
MDFKPDPFAEAEGDGGDFSKVHIRVQQRNGRQCITLIEGLAEDLDIKSLCKVHYIRATHMPFVFRHDRIFPQVATGA